MSIDEYLEIERQRGNIITGGGCGFFLLRSLSYDLMILADNLQSSISICSNVV